MNLFHGLFDGNKCVLRPAACFIILCLKGDKNKGQNFSERVPLPLIFEVLTFFFFFHSFFLSVLIIFEKVEVALERRGAPKHVPLCFLWSVWSCKKLHFAYYISWEIPCHILHFCVLQAKIPIRIWFDVASVLSPLLFCNVLLSFFFFP